MPIDLNDAYIDLLNSPDLWNKAPEKAIRSLVTGCAQALDTARVSVWRLNDNSDKIFCTVLCESSVCEFAPMMELFKKDHPAYFQALETQQIVCADDAQHDPATRSFTKDYLKPLNITSMLDARIMQGGKTYGVLCIEHVGSPRNWTSAEQSFAHAVAGLLSQVLLNYDLMRNEEKFRRVIDGIQDAVILMRDNKMVDCNQKTVEMLGCEREELFRHPPSRFWGESQADGSATRPKAQEYLTRAASGEDCCFEWRHRRLNGQEFDAEVRLSRILLNGEQHIMASLRDINERKIHESKISELLGLQQAIFDSAHYSIFSTDSEGVIASFNRAAEKLLGYTAEEMVGKASILRFHDSEEIKWRAIELSDELNTDIEPGFEVFSAKPKRGQYEEREWTLLSKHGERIPVLLSFTALKANGGTSASETSTTRGYLGIASDISERKRANEQLQNSQKEMEFRANHDDLTGLPNRLRLHDITQKAIEHAHKKQHALALMLLDLNRFKEVNDTLGHALGDQLLKKIAQRLLRLLKMSNCDLFRLGGDEFAILMPHASDTNDAASLAKRVHDTLAKPMEVQDITIELSGSLGVSMFPLHGDNSHSLLRCADVAMYKAKTESAGTIFYQPEQDDHSPRRLRMVAELGTAIREDQLLLHYQPKICLNEKRCVGAEALIRWQHPRLGMVPPGEFIPLAENSEVIQPLGLWVLDKALHQLRLWQDKNLNIDVSINLSARNLMDAAFPVHVKRLLKYHGVDPKLLEIEITESTLIGDPEKALAILNEVHALGVRFAIDDFGTGYSSLSYLKRLPIDTLKIDRSFIRDMLTDEQDAVIVKSTLGLAHSFGLEVVAEGVEDEPTLLALKELACEQAQGFLISKPVPVDAFEQWLGHYNEA